MNKHNMRMQLRFPKTEIVTLAEQYVRGMNKRDRVLTQRITEKVFPSYKRNGFLTKEEFVTVCEWKSPRAKPYSESNDSNTIQEVSALSRKTKSERIRIQIWTLLDGVQWPTASVFLHFAFPKKYPILDIRALWSLGIGNPPQYNFAFWDRYSAACHSIASEANVTMRQLDQALWKYSQLNQER